MPGIAVLIVAAGKGERLGGAIPKQYLPLLGQTVLVRSILAFSRRADIGPVQVVIGPNDHDRFAEATLGLALLPPVLGGSTRQESVANGLEALAAYLPDFVLVHDAARPLVSNAVIDGVIAALKNGSQAAVPLLPVADTLRKKDGSGAWVTVPRDGLMRAQTPQGFAFDAILAAHRAQAGQSVTDDMALAEMVGLNIAIVPGEETNMKITTQDDLAHAERLLRGSLADTRTGFGFDAHRFCEGDHVWLCGIKIPHDKGLEGHSDADAGLHALTDAMLGAIGAGDIGQHFPPTDEKWRGASSDQFLAHAAQLVVDAGGSITHCDVTLICERPKVGPYRMAMRERISQILTLDIDRVSVKATTTEGMGFTGRREGLAAQALVTVRVM